MAAGSYHGELVGMLAVHIFLLATEDYYRAPIREYTGNRVSCDNMEALYTFAKKSKQFPASSSNAGINRAIREVDRRARNKYSLEHVRGHHDRTARFEDILLEAQLKRSVTKWPKK